MLKKYTKNKKNLKKQIIFLEAFPEIMTYKIAKIFRKKGYQTISLRLLKSKGLSEDFYQKAYDKIICFNLDFHKINLRNLPSIFFSFLKGYKNIIKSLDKIRKLKPYLVFGRSAPNWPIALTRFLFKKYPLIYFPYNIRSTAIFANDDNFQKKEDIRNFELKAEEYCFKNSDGILHKGDPLEIEFLEKNIFKRKLKICKNRLNFNPYCFREFMVPLNKEKLSKKDGEIHLVYVGSAGNVNPKKGSDYLFDYAKIFTEQKIHVHFYMKPNTSSKEEIIKSYEKSAGDLINSKYFHIHSPLNPKILSKEISKYDFGLWFYKHLKPGIVEMDAKFTTGNKMASYLEAGIPFFYSDSFGFAHDLMKHYKLDLPIKNLNDAKNISERIKNLDYKFLEKKILIAREDFLMEKQFPRLEEFLNKIILKRKSFYI